MGKWCKPKKSRRARLGRKHKYASREPRDIKNVVTKKKEFIDEERKKNLAN